MKKVKAPRDFLEQVHSRLGKGKKVFFPMPLRLASVAATLVLLVVVYNAMKPESLDSSRLTSGLARDKMKIAKETRPEVKIKMREEKVKMAAKPMERLLSKTAEESFDDLAGAGVSGGIGIASKMAAAPMVTEKEMLSKSNLEPIKKIIKDVQGKIISVDTDKEIITVSIPKKNYDVFLEKVAGLAEVKEPTFTKRAEKTVRLQIKVMPAK